MSYFHVIVGMGNEEECLLTDLTKDDLMRKFVVPYSKAEPIFVAGKVFPTADLKGVEIIETIRNSDTERDGINAKSLREIDEINRNSSVFFVSVGRGYEPGDIREAGENVTEVYLKGAPGYAATGPITVRSSTADVRAVMPTWLVKLLLTIVGGLVVARIAKWLGWV